MLVNVKDSSKYARVKFTNTSEVANKPSRPSLNVFLIRAIKCLGRDKITLVNTPQQQYCFGNCNELLRHGQLGAIWLVPLYFLRYTIY